MCVFRQRVTATKIKPAKYFNNENFPSTVRNCQKITQVHVVQFPFINTSFWLLWPMMVTPRGNPDCHNTSSILNVLFELMCKCTILRSC